MNRFTESNKRWLWDTSCVSFIFLQLLAKCIRVEGNVCQNGLITFKSNSKLSGSFSSPRWPQSYPSNLRCKYLFEGTTDQRVQIHIHEFNIEGLGPNCQKDFLDIYIEKKEGEESLEKSTLLGRYCGHSLNRVPNILVSRYNILVLDFFSDLNTQNEVYRNSHNHHPLGFNANFTFISNKRFVHGSLLPEESDCSYSIDSQLQQSQGLVSSPTYPGLQPDHLNCSVILRGSPGERVRLQFLDFDLSESSGFIKDIKYCPVEKVRILDGIFTDSPLIGEFCGSGKLLKFFSSGSSLRVEWINFGGRIQPQDVAVKGNAEELQRRGYKAEYKISSDFVQIRDKKNHIRGTECDKWIKSNSYGSRTTGYIASPGYSSGTTREYRPGCVCTYYLYGLHNEQERERIELKFRAFQIPQEDPSGKRCTKGQLKVYLRGQDKLTAEPDEIMCGTKTKTLESVGSQMILEFDSTLATEKGLGFEASYTFLVDYGIQGNMVKQDICEYVYRSTEQKEGVINSPFYPDKYPLNLTCRYIFLSQPNEFIRIQFEKFYLASRDFAFTDAFRKEHHTVGMNCTADYVEIREMILNPISNILESQSTLRYCGISVPGPIVSNNNSTQLIVIFHSNEVRVTTGFRALFDFIDKKTVSANCGGVVDNREHGGIIVSPNHPKSYPENIVCEWQIQSTNPLNQMMLQFPIFKVEGAAQNCAKAIVRIYIGNEVSPSSEICGTDSSIQSFIKLSSHIRIRFVVAKSFHRGVGFKISWTEILKPNPDGQCNGFRCLKTGYCIDHHLECNKEPNCGSYIYTDGKDRRDRSDELLHCSDQAKYNLVHVGIGIFLTVLFIISLVIGILYKEHRKNSEKKFHHETSFQSGDDIADNPFKSHLVQQHKLQRDERNGSSSYKSHNYNSHSSDHVDRLLLDSCSHGGGTLTREQMQKISIV